MAQQTYPCICVRCNHSWNARVEFPMNCPRCKSCTFDVKSGGRIHREHSVRMTVNNIKGGLQYDRQ